MPSTDLSIPATAPMPHRKQIRQWLLPLSTRVVAWPLLLLVASFALLWVRGMAAAAVATGQSVALQLAAHTAHHVDMTVPLYRLKRAQARLEEMLPGRIIVQPFPGAGTSTRRAAASCMTCGPRAGPTTPATRRRDRALPAALATTNQSRRSSRAAAAGRLPQGCSVEPLICAAPLPR
jgi:hypothetical protein